MFRFQSSSASDASGRRELVDERVHDPGRVEILEELAQPLVVTLPEGRGPVQEPIDDPVPRPIALRLRRGPEEELGVVEHVVAHRVVVHAAAGALEVPAVRQVAVPEVVGPGPGRGILVGIDHVVLRRVIAVVDELDEREEVAERVHVHVRVDVVHERLARERVHAAHEGPSALFAAVELPPSTLISKPPVPPCAVVYDFQSQPSESSPVLSSQSSLGFSSCR